MGEPLALKYRPRRFEDITGQVVVQKVLHKMVKDGSIRPALLFAGVRGTGKTTTGRIVAAALNCEEAPNGPCTVCASCVAVQNGTSLSVVEIDGATSGLVGDIRALTEMVRYSVGGNYRVVLIDEAHSMSREGFNALLKTLEEPPERTVFILLTTEPGKILDTIVSRCMSFEFRRITTQDIVKRLRHIVSEEEIKISPELVACVAERANGGLRDAVMTLDQCAVAGVRTVEEFYELLGESDFAPDLIKHICARDLPQSLAVVTEQLSKTGDIAGVSSALIACLRDILVLQAGGDISAQGEALDKRQALASLIESQRVFAGMRLLWDVKTKLRPGDSPRALLDLSVVMLIEAMAPEVKSVASPAPEAEKRLTLDQMRSMASARSR